ncbi:unnamed protein product [Durusdinium trenchii]
MPMRLKVDACPGSPGGSGDVEMKDVGKSWLFYGDSLTAGYHAFGCLFEPYALALGEVLQMTEPHELWVCGLSGLAATELLERKSAPFISDAVGRTGHGLERLLSEKTFDLAFIMLGTNDLTDSEDEEIFSAIRQIHEECHRCQVKTVALGVPPSGAAARHRSVGDSRAKVNQQLQAWASSNSMTIFVDTGDLLPWEKDSELWELDGLHFSRLGSQTLGRRLAEHLVPLLREREQSGGEPNRKKKRAGSAARGRRGCGEAACDGMKAVVGEQMNWKTIGGSDIGKIPGMELGGKVLRVKDTLTKEVDYRAFLGRFRVTVVGGPAGGQRWAEELLGRFYGRLLALKGDAGSLEERSTHRAARSELEGFLGGDDGQVSANDALKAFQWVLGNYITEEQTKALLRTLAAHALPDPSPVGRPLGVFEFLSRLDICFQQQASLNSKGSEKRLEKASPWARSVLGRLGRLLWMEDAEGSPKAASARMLQVFRYFDKEPNDLLDPFDDGDGLLQREEFSQAVKQLLAEYKEAESASDERIAELVDLVDISGDGLVNYLESLGRREDVWGRREVDVWPEMRFLHAFQPVDRIETRRGRRGLFGRIRAVSENGIHRSFCAFHLVQDANPARPDAFAKLWTLADGRSDKASLLGAFKFIEEECETGRLSGRVSKENLRRTLKSLNASLEASQGVGVHGAPLTSDQIDIIVDHAVFDTNNSLDYEAFLESFQIVDMGSTREVQELTAKKGAPSDPSSP